MSETLGPTKTHSWLRVVRGLDRPTGWVGLDWVGFGRGSETFLKILKLGKPLVTVQVIPDNLTIINTDK